MRLEPTNVTHPSTRWVDSRATTLIETNVLPPCQITALLLLFCFCIKNMHADGDCGNPAEYMGFLQEWELMLQGSLGIEINVAGLP